MADIEVGAAPLGAKRAANWFEISLVGALIFALIGMPILVLHPPIDRASALASLYAASFLPAIIVLGVAGFRRHRVPSWIIALFNTAALVGAGGLIASLRMRGDFVDDLRCAAILAASQSIAIGALWVAYRLPHVAGRPALPIVGLGTTSIATLLGAATFSVLSSVRQEIEIGAPVLCGLYALGLIPSVTGNWLQARREKRIPADKTDKAPDHISGVGAGGLLAFMIVIVVLGIWATATGATAMIDTLAGSIVIFGLACAFLVVAVAPLLPPIPFMAQLMKGLRYVAKPLGLMVSFVDSLLVFPIAGTLGASQSKLLRRYILLLGNLVPCAFLGWWLPAPYGLVPLGFAVVGAVAIARRWAWIEEDRENAMLNRKFDGAHLRVGFKQDLRDETLVAFAALLFLVPLALRQLYFDLGPATFVLNDASDRDNVFVWFSFFGTELAKALPFVDWAEVYHVEGDAPIRLDSSHITAGNHVVFASRILVDLVLLAAFLQAIAITQRTKKLRDMFYVDQTIDQLDPFIEPGAFRKMVRSGTDGFEFIESEYEKFPRYNEERLHELSARKDEVGFAATCLLERYEAGGPEDQLLAQSKRPNPDRTKCDELIEALESDDHAKVLTLKSAHFNLNSKATYWPVRKSITALIARQTDEDVAINSLSEILIGPGHGVADYRQEVRSIALAALYRPALLSNRVALDSIRRAAKHDGAVAVRAAAQGMLEGLPAYEVANVPVNDEPENRVT